MILKFQNALENARLALKILILALISSFILNILLILGWCHSVSEINVHFPPQIPEAGITLKAGVYPNAIVYSFSYYIWQSINHWPSNGTEDYKQAIQKFTPFLTPRFKSFLLRDYQQRLDQGELQERIRTLAGLNGTVFDINDVKQVSPEVWTVHLKMRLSEHMNINSDSVKDVDIEYVLRIVRYDIDAKANPWGLAIDGFEENPTRLQTYT